MPDFFGIDLGNCFSKLCSINSDAIPSLIASKDSPQNFLTPSEIAAAAEQVAIGEKALLLAQDLPQTDLLRDFLPRLGSGKPLSGSARNWSADSLAGLILHQLNEDAIHSPHGPIGQAVIAVPACWDSRKRRGLKRACRLASLERVRLVDASLAIVRSSEALSESPKEFLVCDIGDKHLEASIVHGSTSELAVVASHSCEEFGGRFLSSALAKDWTMKHQSSRLRITSDNVWHREVERVAANLVRNLASSSKPNAEERRFISGQPIKFELTREAVVRHTKPILDALVALITDCLDQAEIKLDTLHAMVFTGGLSSLVEIKQSIASRLGINQSLIETRQPLFGPVFGAGLLSQDFERPEKPLKIVSRTSFEIGLRMRKPNSDESLVVPLIPRNSSLPKRASCTLKTNRIDQERLVVELVHSGPGLKAPESLGIFEFGPLQPTSERHPTELVVLQNEDGTVEVTARDGVSRQPIPILDDAPSTSQRTRRLHLDREGYNWGIARLL